MRNYILYVSLLLQLSISTMIHMVQSAPPPQIINNNTIQCNPQNNANNGVNIEEISSTTTAYLTASLTQLQQQATRLSTYVSTQVHAVVTTTVTTTMSMLERAKQHWPKIVGACTATGYLWLIWKAWAAKEWLSSPMRWSRWLALHDRDLGTIQDEVGLQKNLMLEIAQRYVNPEEPIDYLYPLIQFGIQIDQELGQLRHLYNWQKWISKSQVHRLIFTPAPTLSELASQIERAEHVRLLFRKYIAAHNVQAYLANYADNLYKTNRIARIPRCIEEFDYAKPCLELLTTDLH